MKMRYISLLFTIFLCALFSASIQGQTEARRAFSGFMQGRSIQVSTESADKLVYRIDQARITNGKLEFTGSILVNGKEAGKVSSTLVGTTARASNPWPGSKTPVGKRREQPQGREARTPEAAGQLGSLAQSTQPTARTTPAPAGENRPEGEVTEQTQSLYAKVDTGSGCELMFLSLTFPDQAAKILGSKGLAQLGLVLDPKDNQLGEDISSHVCQIVRVLGKQDNKQTSEQLSKLNSILAGR
jgi:hypothetical protein